MKSNGNSNKKMSPSEVSDWMHKSRVAPLWKKRTAEYLKRKLITMDQMLTLNKMIDSKDLDSRNLFLEVVAQILKENLVIGLNDGQKKAFEQIVDYTSLPFPGFLDEGAEAFPQGFVLKGYAGTGKTFLIKRVIEYICNTDTNAKIAIGAPTNKAVQVLYKSSGANATGHKGYVFEDIFDKNARIVYSTIHKLLGLKETITDKGEQLFLEDSMNDSELSKFSYLIVDEVSMLDDDLCKKIMQYSDRIKIIFMGDPAQIPPVKRKDALPLKNPQDHSYRFLYGELTEIMRQQGEHPIVDASFAIRTSLHDPEPLTDIKTQLNDKGHGIIRIDLSTEKDKIKPILKQYFDTPDFAENNDYMRVIAWKNATVDYINSVVRELIYGKNPERFIVGEKLIAKKPISEKLKSDKDHSWDYWKVVYPTSEELTVEEVFEDYITIEEGEFKLKVKVYELDVSSVNVFTGSVISRYINVIHEDSEIAYKNLLEKARQKAMSTKKGIDWVIYFNLMKWSAEVMYGYAITAHKSQGSTYKNVMIMESDVDANNKIVERNRIKYTAYSRATDVLFVVK